MGHSTGGKRGQHPCSRSGLRQHGNAGEAGVARQAVPKGVKEFGRHGREVPGRLGDACLAAKVASVA